MNFGGSRLGFWFAYSPFTITWETEQYGLLSQCGPGGWYVSNQGLLIRFVIQDSQNCPGGCNPNTQFGTATATITTGDSNYNFFYNLSGVAEYQNAAYELMDLYIQDISSPNKIKLVTATAIEGNLGCDFYGPADQIVHVQPPYLLLANTTYFFSLDFTTNDPLYHTNCYYECSLNFTRAP